MRAQDAASSHTVFHHTAYTKWAQEAASNTVSYHTAHIVLYTGDIMAMRVCQFHKDLDEQARSTADIVAMQVCQFQKDRDEQARRKF